MSKSEIFPLSVAELEVTPVASSVLTLPFPRLKEDGVQRHADKHAVMIKTNNSLFLI